MKHFTKRAVSLLIALTLMLTLSLTAFAFTGTGSGSIKVQGKELTGKDVTLVQMFSATEDTTVTPMAISYTLIPQWESFFTSNPDYGCTGTTSAEISSQAYNYIYGISNDTAALAEFAAAAETWAKTNAATLAAASLSVTQEAAVDTTDPTMGSTTFTAIPYGYYLTYPASGSTDATRHTDAMLLDVINNTLVTQTIKSAYPTVEKKVTGPTASADGHTGTAQVGDTITFTLTSQVPDMTGYTSYDFSFADILSPGLTFNEITSATVGGNDAISNITHEVTPNPVVAGQQSILSISFTNFYGNYSTNVGEDIIITYTATLNDYAATGTGANGANTNSAVVQYSHDPSNPTNHHSSTPSEVKVFSMNIGITKYTGEVTNHLAGAEFELRTSNTDANTALHFIENATSNTVYKVAANPADAASVTTLTTKASGTLNLYGLNVGTYYLYETKAPDGYNALTAPITVVISNPTYNTEGNLSGYTVTYNGTTASDDHQVMVENRAGAVLPSTGSIGTIGLTVAGVVLIILGIVFIPRKKKETNS